jgi:putative glycosyltransferase (TIGR04372 family)
MRLRKIASKLILSIWRFVQVSIWSLPAIVMWFTPYRMVKARLLGIGHLATELDYFVKKRQLGSYSKIRPIFIVKRRHGLNETLLRIWSQHLTIMTNRIAYDLLRPFQFFPSLCIDLAEVVRVENAAQYQTIVNQWGSRAPVFELPLDLVAAGNATLREMGLPENSWFVAVHSRDGVYSPSDEHLYSYRNCDIANYSAAVNAIIARGGWCIRMGEKGTASLTERPGLVNYPDTVFKSEWMDLFLCNQARFFLGNTSGLALVSTISGVPCALANMVPLGCVYGFSPLDISIPKLAIAEDGTKLPFATIFASELSNYRATDEFERDGVNLIENSPSEIWDLAVEMLDSLGGTLQRTAEDEARQEAFRRLLTPRHYTYGARSRIGMMFLRQHKDLLE